MGADSLSQLPHGFPFRYVDRILEHVPGKRIVTLKNVSVDEPFMTGYFPDSPSMPGTYQLEAMAQTAGILASGGLPAFLAQVRDFRLEQEISPGDQLVIEANLVQGFGSLQRCEVAIRVDDNVTCRAEIVLSVGS